MDMANDAIYRDVENHIRKSDKILKNRNTCRNNILNSMLVQL